MSVVALMDGFSGLCCDAEKSRPQLFRIVGRDSQNRIEDPGLVLSLPVEQIQRILLQLRSYIRPIAVGNVLCLSELG